MDSLRTPSDMKEARQAQLRALLKEHGGSQVELAKTLRKSPAQINHWLNGVKGISEASAREIEAQANRPPGWLDGELPFSAQSPRNESEQSLPTVTTAQLRRLGPGAQEFVAAVVDRLSSLLEDPKQPHHSWREVALGIAASADIQQGVDTFTQFCIAVDIQFEKELSRTRTGQSAPAKDQAHER